MTARVITDPSALGWVLDPDTGRWEWSGSGDGGGSGGGGAWELLETVEVPVKTSTPWVTQVDITGFTEDHRQYEVLMHDVAPISTAGQALSMITIGMNMTNGYDIYNPTTQCQTWDSSVWMTSKHYTPNSNTSGQWHQVFGSDPNMQFSNRDGINGVFKIRTGTLQMQATDILPDNTTFEWSGSTGKTHFRSTGVAQALGMINTLSFNVNLDGYGLRSGVFQLFGLKRN